MNRQHHDKPSYFTAGLVGAVAALGAVAAVLLSKRENREKVRHELEDLIERGEQLAARTKAQLVKQAETLADRAKETTDRAADRTKEMAQQAGETADERVRQAKKATETEKARTRRTTNTR
jgi:DNA anti-recombination protein RmuC